MKAPVKVPAKTQQRAQSSNTNKADTYLEQKVMSAKPEELTLMLYEGIIKFVKQAKFFNDKKDMEQSNYANLRAQAIIQELRATLDMSVEISGNFESLYIFMNERLVDANMKKDNTILDEVLDLATEFRDAWKQAMKL
ncbi:MAG: flagellar export chaperone FliS [Clostridia bacterium]|nr:flagellar export chaperone FliS [Clostridia bacterium]